jgi:hypothetical protein
MSLKLNTSSGGSITVAPTNTASNFTLTVPAQSGSVVTADSSGNVGINGSVRAFGSYTEDSTNIGVHVGYTNGSPRIGFFNGTASQNWQIDNNSGEFRWFTPGVVRMALDSSGNLKFNSGYGSAATSYGCRAWVNFNGTGTVAIRASGNVSSITDNGNGQYTVNFTNAMPDVNYAATFNGNGNSDSFGSGGRQYSMIRTRATNSVQLNTIDEGGNQTDPSYVGLSIFR